MNVFVENTKHLHSNSLVISEDIMLILSSKTIFHYYAYVKCVHIYVLPFFITKNILKNCSNRDCKTAAHQQTLMQIQIPYHTHPIYCQTLTERIAIADSVPTRSQVLVMVSI